MIYFNIGSGKYWFYLLYNVRCVYKRRETAACELQFSRNI